MRPHSQANKLADKMRSGGFQTKAAVGHIDHHNGNLAPLGIDEDSFMAPFHLRRITA